MAVRTRELKIVWANAEQKILWDVEMSGQVSDGRWEISRPLDHYIDMTAADTSFSGSSDEQGTRGFRPKRSYNFSFKELLDIVGQRALDAVRILKAFPGEDEAAGNAEYILHPNNKEKLIDPSLESDKYWVELYRRGAKALNITDEASYADAMARIKGVSYGWRDMVKDLRQMSAIIRNSRRSY